ncbi:TetR/AcrR family transcriptional regulator [Paracholeplasma manati]|uniref:TetR/AcrR family transcriptional regulator n=1 Tax=Paracholeplasma manati TaxID=591373 RepID=UPI002407CC30|nr:TetR/AcrR family transcriptional regulator [Paracholeplasma manati]MDG0888986.1 TetR/AcrR family transcriptional regulator [Paracholeplasma manati]
MKETEKKILLAATKLFSENGYANTSTKKIADAAGVNELTIFRQFKSKSNLLQAVIHHHAFEGYIVDKIAHLITNDVKKDIEIFTHTYYLFLKNNIKMYLIQVRETDDTSKRFTNTIDYTAFMKKYFQQKKEEGTFVGDPNLISTSIVSMVMGIFTLKVYAPEIYHDTDYHDLMNIFIENLIKLYTK